MPTCATATVHVRFTSGVRCGLVTASTRDGARTRSLHLERVAICLIDLHGRGEAGIRTLGLRRATPTLYRLSYNPMVESKGVEPFPSACKADVQPLTPKPHGLGDGS